MRQVLMAAALASGCSFVLVRGSTEPARRRDSPPCVSSAAAPIIDTLLAAALAAAAIDAQLELDDLGPAPPDGDHSGQRSIARLQRDLALVTGVFFGLSATYGHVRTARCRSARDAHAAAK